jgi:chromosome segregation ATPase
MEQTDHIDLVAAFKRLLAESKSQEAMLEDYAKIIYRRDTEIEMLQTMLTEASEYRSSVDVEVKELKDLQSYLNGVQQQAERSTYTVTGGKYQQITDNISIEQQFEQLKLAYSYLQTQLTDLQTQLMDVNSRNTILQQQIGRVAELESLLLNVEQERDGLKQKE